MKNCEHCGIQFIVSLKRPTQIFCGERCSRNAHKKRYRKKHGCKRNSTPNRVASQKKRKAARVKRNQDHVYEDKIKKGCSRCPERRPSCLDYHHLDRSTKLSEVTRLARCGLSFQTLVDEMAKCILLCACCHRAEELGSGFRENENIVVIKSLMLFATPYR